LECRSDEPSPQLNSCRLIRANRTASIKKYGTICLKLRPVRPGVRCVAVAISIAVFLDDVGNGSAENKGHVGFVSQKIKFSPPP